MVAPGLRDDDSGSSKNDSLVPQCGVSVISFDVATFVNNEWELADDNALLADHLLENIDDAADSNADDVAVDVADDSPEGIINRVACGTRGPEGSAC